MKMEATSQALRIHVSENTQQLLKENFAEFKMDYCGLMDTEVYKFVICYFCGVAIATNESLQAKQGMETYWLTSYQNEDD